MTDDAKVGTCEWCGGGVWSDMHQFVRVRGWVWHRACAEALQAELGKVI